MTQKVMVANTKEGGYTVDVFVWEEAPPNADGHIARNDVETHTLAPGECISFNIWQGRGFTAMERKG